MTTQAQIKASRKYDRTHTKAVMLKLNQNNDADILMKLTTVENKQGYIKRLIRQDLQNQGKILTKDSIAMLILPVCRRHQIERVYLIGSYARGEATENSDIDLMIEGSDKQSMFEFSDISEELEEAVGKKIDLIEYEAVLSDQSRSGKRFRYNIEKDKELIYG